MISTRRIFSALRNFFTDDPEPLRRDGDNVSISTREYAVRRGWKIVSEYVDQGVSGSKESRPELNRLMADAHKRRFDYFSALVTFELLTSISTQSNIATLVVTIQGGG